MNSYICTKERKKVKLLSRDRLFATPWTGAYQVPPSMGFFQTRILEWVAISFSRKTHAKWTLIWEGFLDVRGYRSNTIVQFRSVQSLSRVRLFVTPRIAARQASLSITNS